MAMDQAGMAVNGAHFTALYAKIDDPVEVNALSGRN